MVLAALIPGVALATTAHQAPRTPANKRFTTSCYHGGQDLVCQVIPGYGAPRATFTKAELDGQSVLLTPNKDWKSVPGKVYGLSSNPGLFRSNSGEMFVAITGVTSFPKDYSLELFRDRPGAPVKGPSAYDIVVNYSLTAYHLHWDCCDALP
jgi:hypothetical protein